MVRDNGERHVHDIRLEVSYSPHDGEPFTVSGGVVTLYRLQLAGGKGHQDLDRDQSLGSAWRI